MSSTEYGLVLTAALGALLTLAGCRQDMHDQPRFKPYAQTDFFRDQLSARPLVPGTVAQGELREDELLYTGKVNGADATEFPFQVTSAVVSRGRQRFDIYCSPCHGRLGDGEGMIPSRGFRHPPSFHTDKLRSAPVGHFVDVMTNGFGAMVDYAARVAPSDRWAIAAYIRALQLSQNVAVAEIPAEQRRELEAQPK
jgi:mono/diheme cytochrome c family protein